MALALILSGCTGAAGAYRYALLKYPNLDTFALEVDVACTWTCWTPRFLRTSTKLGASG